MTRPPLPVVPPAAPRRGARRRPLLTFAIFVASGLPAPAADEATERTLLQRSWEQACGRYDEATMWTARQACNLAWFRAHEKDVWRHNLNPHGPAAAGPSS